MFSFSPAEADEHKWFVTLMTAHEFADGEIGEGPHPSECYLAYREALVEPEKITEEQLQELHKKATPAGKLYAACMAHYARIARKQPANADRDLKELVNDKSKFFYRSGCRGTNSTVGEAATKLLEEKKFLSFTLEDLARIKSTHGVPGSILKLSSARRLENGVVGEGSNSVLYAYYKEARVLPLKANGWEITWLRKHGSPAGKLYGCFLAMKIDENFGTQYFRELENNADKVQYQSGCEVETFTVGAIARQVVEKRKFADFEM